MINVIEAIKYVDNYILYSILLNYRDLIAYLRLRDTK